MLRQFLRSTVQILAVKIRLLDLSADLANLSSKKHLFLRNNKTYTVRWGACEIFNCLVNRHSYCGIATYLAIQPSILKSHFGFHRTHRT
jgi:hypothetical protein